LLWLKELETYKRFPPLQSPESWNLDTGRRHRSVAPDGQSHGLLLR
jgi:hypothetical protein